MQNKLLIYCPKITPRHQYIFKVLFSDIYVIEYSLTDDKEAYIASEFVKINYSKNSICHDEVFVESNGLLSEKGINELDIQIQLVNGEPAFFIATNKNAYPFDIFATSFYLISRYEEYLPHLKDKYNRYKAEESLAYKHRFLQKPIVNIWLKQFIHQLQSQFPNLIIQYPKFKYISTIDIDNAYLYKGKGFIRSVAFC